MDEPTSVKAAVRSEPRRRAISGPADCLRRLIGGYQATFLVQVAAELNLADLLADGPRGAEELAAATGGEPERAATRPVRARAARGVRRRQMAVSS